MTDLELDLHHGRGGFRLRARATASFRRLALFGPSGAGKTTILDLLAGLKQPDRGTIRVGSNCFVDTRNGVFTPPEQRRVGYLMQDAPLFPHRSVRGNITYSGRVDPSEKGAQRIVDLLEIGHLMGREPDGLSGGERRRVALARTLFARPRILLLDEPTSGLNEALRARILPDLRRLIDHLEVPLILVSHRPEVVQALCETVIPVREGETGTVSSAPAYFHGDAAGSREMLRAVNYYAGRVEETGEDGPLRRIRTEAGLSITVPPREDLDTGDPVVVKFAAEEPLLGRDLEGLLSPRNRWMGRVRDLEHESSALLVTADVDGELMWIRVTEATGRSFALNEGDEVMILLKSQSIHVYPA